MAMDLEIMLHQTITSLFGRPPVSMSFPIYQLQELSLDPSMPVTTRAQRQQYDYKSHQQPRRMQSVVASVEQPTPRPASDLVIARTGTRYNVRDLSPTRRASAVRGLQSDEFMVDISRTHDSEDGPYHAFQLKKPESVRIYDPNRDSNSEGKVVCTCDDFRRQDPESHRMCVHICWLFDGLRSIFIPPDTSTVSISGDSLATSLIDMYEDIGERIDLLPEQLNQTREEGATDTDTADEAEDTTLQDMMSVMDPTKLPRDYTETFLRQIRTPRKSFQDVVVPGNIQATVFGLARSDHVFKGRLRNAINKTLCGQDYFKKQDARAEKLLVSLDDYAQNGPVFNPRRISQTGEKLRSLINEMAEYKDSARAPLSRELLRMVATLVVGLLRKVCDRNHDIYLSSTWLDRQSHAPAATECNLFLNLVRNPPRQFSEQFFVLDFLDSIDPAAYSHLVDRMQALVHDLGHQRAPRTFIAKLQSIINNVDDNESEHAHPLPHAEAAHRRPSVSGQPDARRRRLR